MADLFSLTNQLKSASTIRQSKKGKGIGLGERIIEARVAVEKSLGDYKNRVRTLWSADEVEEYFNNTGDIIAIDTETMGQFKAQLYSNI